VIHLLSILIKTHWSPATF